MQRKRSSEGIPSAEPPKKILRVGLGAGRRKDGPTAERPVQVNGVWMTLEECPVVFEGSRWRNKDPADKRMWINLNGAATRALHAHPDFANIEDWPDEPETESETEASATETEEASDDEVEIVERALRRPPLEEKARGRSNLGLEDAQAIKTSSPPRRKDKGKGRAAPEEVKASTSRLLPNGLDAVILPKSSMVPCLPSALRQEMQFYSSLDERPLTWAEARDEPHELALVFEADRRKAREEFAKRTAHLDSTSRRMFAIWDGLYWQRRSTAFSIDEDFKKLAERALEFGADDKGRMALALLGSYLYLQPATMDTAMRTFDKIMKRKELRDAAARAVKPAL